MQKLILSEDFEEEVIQEEPVLSYSAETLLSELIKREWENVDYYNSVILSMPEGNQKVIDEINELINNHYINIGQLENIFSGINGEAGEFLEVPAEEN